MKTLMAACLGLALLGWKARAARKDDANHGARGSLGDALNLCSASYSNEDALLACMQANVVKLTAGCRPVFLQGLRRRGLD